MNLATSYKFAKTEVKSTLRSFLVMILCLALGVASIITINTLVEVLNGAVMREGRVILGGNISLSIVGREASLDELKLIEGKGVVSKQITLRTMIRDNAGHITLVELKAVDDLYPLYGALLPSAKIIKGGAIAEEAFFIKMDAKIGDKLILGESEIVLSDKLINEPDKLAQGLGLGPKVIVSLDTLMQSKLISQGSLMRVHYRLKTTGDVELITQELQNSLKASGFDVRSSDNASPQLSNQIKRFGEVLGLSSFITLLIGALGISYAVERFVEKKRNTIATLKALGANNATVLKLYALQILTLSLIGIVFGVVIGIALPYLLEKAFGALLPLALGTVFSMKSLVLGVVYGLIIASMSAILPLDRMRHIKVAALYRDDGGAAGSSRAAVMICALLAVILVVIAILSSHQRWVIMAFFAAMVVIYGLLKLMIWALQKLVKRISFTHYAMKNFQNKFSASKSPQATMMLALSLGLTLMTILFLVEGTISSQLSAVNLKSAPSFFFVDIPKNEDAKFEALVKEQFPKSQLVKVANLRGRIIALNGVAAEKAEVAPSVRWIFQGDRGVTMADDLPQGSILKQGKFWDKNYDGVPLVSMEDKLAGELGLKIGDKITVSVLGRAIEATLSNRREVKWQSFGINFFMVFSSNTFKGAPHTWLATLTSENSSATDELALLTSINKAYPSITSVRVKEAIEAVNNLSSRISMAMQAVSLISLLAAMLVLSSIMAANENARKKEVTLYKVLGARRSRILSQSLVEFGMLGLFSAFVALLAGGLVTTIVSVYSLKLTPILDFKGGAMLLIIALIITLLLGLYGTLQALKTKPAEVLRHL